MRIRNNRPINTRKYITTFSRSGKDDILKQTEQYLEATMTYFPFNYSSVPKCVFTSILTVFCNS